MASDSNITNKPSPRDISPVSAGGAPLHSSFERLDMDDKLSDSMIATYDQPAGPHRHSHGLRASSALGHAGEFQIGHSRDDGDVFMGSSQVVASTSASDIQHGSSSLSLNDDLLCDVTALSTQHRSVEQRARKGRPGEVDAQIFYPATACVFVANLPEAVDDLDLEASVTKAFSDYGSVFVKIRRDQRNMPFAFCQYTDDEHAKTAMRNGKGKLIEGRPCRTEMVKANRSFVIHKIEGDALTADDARELMSVYGPVSKCEPLHAQIAEALNIEGGFLVEYTTFDPNRDVIAAFKTDPDYRVIAYDLKKSLKGPRPGANANEAWMAEYDVDRRSVFVGNLPTDIDNTKEILEGYMGQVGDVSSVQIIQKEARSGYGGPVAFAFVEFSRPDMTDLAIQRMDGTYLEGSRIRVERKFPRRSMERSAKPRIMSNRSFQEPGSPTHGCKKPSNLPSTPMRATPRITDGSVQNPGSSAHDIPMSTPFPFMASPLYTHSASPFGPNAGPFPATPNHNMIGGYYYTPPQMNWATPYLQDPQYAGAAWMHLQSPMQNASGAASGFDDQTDPNTPTRRVTGTQHES